MFQCKPPLPQNRVPLVRDLCQALGFGDGYERAEHDLKDYTQSWRKQYTTDDGTRGKDLTDWKSAKVQNGLLRMTKDFLEIGGYAVSHWPSREEGRARNVPEYPRDHQKITELLCQLFWRENTNQVHNAKHPNRGRRIRESTESDRSDHTSGTMISPSTTGHAHFQHTPGWVPPQFASPNDYHHPPTTYPRNESLQSLRKPSNHRTADEQWHNGTPTQASASPNAPSMHDKETSSSSFPKHVSTLSESSAQTPQPETKDDDYEYHGTESDDVRKTPKKKVVMLKFKQARGRNALAKLRTPPSKTITTPTIIQSEHNTITPYDKSKSKSPSAEAQGKSSTESKAKRNDGGGDDEDKEITPRRRARKRKLVSSSSEHSIAKSKSARSGPDSAHENEVSPIVRSVEHRGDALPTRSKLRSQNKPFRLKGPTKPDSAQVHGSLPPLQDDPEIHNLVDEGVEYVRALEAVQQQDLRLSPSNVTQDQTEKTPTPSAFTPNDQVSREATTGQTPIAEERQDHIPHQSAQRSESSQPQPGSKPKIRYYVISSLYRRLWPDVSLGEKSIEAMFNDVEPFAGKKNIEHIIFKLTTSQRSAEFKIPRHDPEIYEEMKVDFAAEISKDLARGKTNFKIELEPDPKMEVMAVETQEDDVGPKFSW